VSTTTQSAEKLISLSELGRLLNLSSPRLLAYHAAGLLGRPDYTTNTSVLWKADRVPAIKAAVKDYGLEKSIKANAARQRKS
jgi:hypothetical protein